MEDKPTSDGWCIAVPAVHGGALVLKAPSSIESVDMTSIIRILEVIKKDLEEAGF